MRISKLSFKFGESVSKPLEAQLRNITIVVGPNNSGKSETLRDVEGWCLDQNYRMKLLSSIEMELPVEEADVEKIMNEFKTEPPKTENLGQDEIWLSIPNYRANQVESRRVRPTDFKDHFKHRHVDYLRGFLLRGYSIRLDGRTRFNLIDTRPMGDLKGPPANYFASLFHKDAERKRLREIVFDEFGLYLYIDPTVGGNLSLVMTGKPITNERSLEKDTIQQFKEALPLITLGDGLQAFVGLLIAIISLPHKIILVDEPEAFLHPPTAESLGRHLSSFARERDGSLIVATHSPEFLLGCLETSSEVTLVRLTYDNAVGTARLLKPEDVKTLATDPLLRSSDTLNALFHKTTVVTEADQDRVFYSEINRKLLEKNKGMRDVVFLNAQNKHTVHRIIGPLRKIGVPAAAIYDLDVIREERMKNEDTTLWKKIMNVANIPDSRLDYLEGQRAILEAEFAKLKKEGQPDPLKKVGVEALSEKVRESAYEFLEELKKYGIFIIPIGELEQWEKSLGRDTSKIWLVDMLEKINSLTSTPEEGVWKFVSDIQVWSSDPRRLGMLR